MSDKQTHLDDIEVAAMWYMRKLDDVQASVTYAGRQSLLGNSAFESISKSVDALQKADARLKAALDYAKDAGVYRSDAEKATLKGMERR